MASVLILVFAALALAQFVLAQWRAIWLSTANQPLSDNLKLVAGIEADCLDEHDFRTVLSLCDKLAPGARKVSPWLPGIARYYTVLALLERPLQRLLPRLSQAVSREMRACCRFVAVALDQHLSVDLDRRVAVRS
ncbi:MAG TPA: hypothetical protein VLX32_02095 [Candidatus Acidoferrum sp.]|nr:hypothetical protein [Candidatus Acidoferrum sp.]